MVKWLTELWYKLTGFITYPDKNGTPWTKEDIEIMKTMAKDGYTDYTIGEVIGRTESAVYNKRMALARKARNKKAKTRTIKERQ